jgi:hypothetical protein
MGKNKVFLLNRLQDMYGESFHPIMQMAKNCDVLQKIADAHAEGAITMDKAEAGNAEVIDASSSAKLANEAWDKIAPYTEAKLTASSIALQAEDVTVSNRKELEAKLVANGIDPDGLSE